MKWVGLIAIWTLVAGAAAIRLAGEAGSSGVDLAGSEAWPVAVEPRPAEGRTRAPATERVEGSHAGAEPFRASASVTHPEPPARDPDPRPSAVAAEAPAAAPSPSPTPRRRYRRRDRYWLDMPYSPANWAPPEGPVRIGLQAGHWRADEAPDELAGLRGNGARIEGKAEWEVNLEIARQAAAMLEGLGYVVDVLPAVVPPGYRAHLFISIHADGSRDAAATGYRVASPRRDVTGRAQRAAALLDESYGDATGLARIPTVTRRMQNYYAFNFYRYQHALHPQTIGVILETGFLTSASDRRVIVDDPARAARGIVSAVTAFPETPPPRGLTLAAAGMR